MNGAHDNRCVVAENLSVFFYHGSNTLQYIYYVTRYREVYGGMWSLALPVFVIIVYAAGIPLSIILNETAIAADGSCSVIHPPISSFLPLTASFMVSVYMLIMFLAPFVKQCMLPSEDRNPQLVFVARNLFITNTIAICFNIFFNLSLITPLEQYAPLLSMVDLTINYLMVCLPYFLTRLCTARGNSFRWTAENQHDRETTLHQSDHCEGGASKYHHSEYGHQFPNSSSRKSSDENGVIPLVAVHKFHSHLG
ncbi:hypothetical protein K493DRAFT_410746 [Basidiobolus meristosporus CBS 931.73]|uniref:Uncharacterized protein n=1 Tax=Basidiobolus meristosporus CBS 931.73 TaxID=1314790 RepID=A0A1Y1XT37_9FUNG|nr:hypothetical protein K493DRAFT_410746 [Basidiobolus meristosporus CBS 931.73]|eukprot:ORX88911.1 hypothetical protein K493DRAFT_410746 [Basidiobolus meristosporus CBS 931.73]